MNLDSITSLASFIVVVALVTTVLRRGSSAAQVIRAVGDSFSSAIRAATA